MPKAKPIDPVLRTWCERAIDLRHALGYSIRKLARISGIRQTQINCLMSGRERGRPYNPSIITIRKIQLMEKVFDLELSQYRSNPSKYDRLQWVANKNPKERLAYGGEGEYKAQHPKRLRRRLPPVELPRRPEDLAALGGAEAFRTYKPTLPAKFIIGREERIRLMRIRRWASHEATFGSFKEIVESWSRIENDPALAAGLSVEGGEGERGADSGVHQVSAEDREGGVSWCE